MIDNLLKILAPHPCYGCGKSGSILCENCIYNISSDVFGRCIWCLSPVSRDEQCRSCSVRLKVRAAWAVGARQDTLERLINGYKYESAREAGPVLARLLGEKVAILPVDTVVTTVPTVASHVRQRGFDHAALLARRFATARSLPYAPLFIRRLDIAQHTLSRRERLKYAKEAFDLKIRRPPRSVLVIDDILTTGATLQACVSLLREAGVEEIHVAIAARQLFSEMP